MKNNRGNIELLLLLCCLVGVITLVSLSLGLSNAFREPLQNDELTKEWQDLLREKEAKEKEFQGLEDERKRIEQKIKEVEVNVTSAGVRRPELQLSKLAEELASLTRERDTVLVKIETIRNELARIPVAPDPRPKEEKQKELGALLKELEDIAKKIKQKSQEREGLARVQGEGSGEYSESEGARIKTEITRVRNAKKVLEDEIKSLNTRVMMGGNSSFKSPLFVECKKDVYVFYPGGETVGIAELEKRDIFKQRATGHDIIVLFVRPEGFSSFGKAYGKVKTLPVALSYEPLDVDQSLDFLRG